MLYMHAHESCLHVALRVLHLNAFIVPGKLTIHNLGDVLEAVWEARSKWYNIGLKLGISAGALDSIKASSQNQGECLTAMIKDWLRSGRSESSWGTVAEALKSPMVEYAWLAEQLPPQGTNTGHSSCSSIRGKHSRSYSEDTQVAKKNKNFK